MGAAESFAYFRPKTAQEAIALLSQSGGSATILAGGQTLLPLLNMQLASPDALIDIGQIAELRGIELKDDKVLVGALTRHCEIEASDLLQERCPMLPAAAAFIGHSHIRNRGTIGGVVAHADPAAEYPVALVALGAEIELAGPGGTRLVPADEFFIGPLMTTKAPDEIVVGVRVPVIERGTGWDFQELTFRSGDFAFICVAGLLAVDGGLIKEARLAVGGVGPVATRLPAAEALLVGKSPSSDLWRLAAEAAAEELEIIGDAWADAEYRRFIAAVYVENSLQAQHERGG